MKQFLKFFGEDFDKWIKEEEELLIQQSVKSTRKAEGAEPVQDFNEEVKIATDNSQA